MSTAAVFAFTPFETGGSAPRSTGSAHGHVRSRLRLTARGRIVLITLATVPLIIAVAMLAFNGGGAAALSDAQGVHFSHITVMSGDSLWGIADSVAPAADPRDVVASIVDLNQLETSMVVPGQKLAIPAQYANHVQQ